MLHDAVQELWKFKEEYRRFLQPLPGSQESEDFDGELEQVRLGRDHQRLPVRKLRAASRPGKEVDNRIITEYSHRASAENRL